MLYHAKTHAGCMHVSCNLPPALLAEWPGSFTCYCSNMGVEWILKLESAQKIYPCEENSPTTPARTWTGRLLITSPPLKQLSWVFLCTTLLLLQCMLIHGVWFYPVECISVHASLLCKVLWARLFYGAIEVLLHYYLALICAIVAA